MTAAARATVGQVITVEIQPRTYASPNGEYRLHVKPGERHGGGPAEYTLTRNGATVWNGERGFTLLDVILTDEGAAAGYGYWKGPQGFGDLNRKSLTKEELKEARKRMEELRDALEKAATSGASRPADGLPVPEFPMEPDTDWACIVYLSASGDVKLCHRIPRSGESSCLSSPSVAVGYVSLDTANDSLTAIVHHNRPSDDHTNLVVFRVSTATVLVDMPLEKRLEPRTPVFHVFAARAIRGTPLTVVSYAGRKRSTSNDGCFAIVDLTRRVHWDLFLPDDYEIEGDERAEYQLFEEMRLGGTLLPNAIPGEFTIRAVKDNKAITFRADERPDGGWKIQELRRDPYVKPEPLTTSRSAKETTSSFAQVPARLLGVIELETRVAPKGEIRDCWELAATGDGNLAFERFDREAKQRRFVVVNPMTREVRSFEAGVELAFGSSYAPYSKDRWLVVGSARGVADAKGTGEAQQVRSVFALDPSTGKCERLTTSNVGDCQAVFPLVGASFGVLAGFGTGTDMPWSLTGFTNGVPAWGVPESYDDPQALSSPKSACLTTRGEIAVLENIGAKVKFYDVGGKILRSVDLVKSWGRRPVYPSKIGADVEGGVIVYDFNGAPPVVRMKADGTVLSSLTPAFKDGRLIANPVVVTPDGRLWTTDGHCLCRLDERGVVVEILGERPNADDLGEIARVALGPNRQIHAVASRTGAVHVFDATGRRLRVCQALATDFGTSRISTNHLTVTSSGDVYLERELLSSDTDGEYLHFDRTGKRLGVRDFSIGDVHCEVYFQPSRDSRWVVGFQRVLLTDARGAIQRTIERGTEGEWFTSIASAAQAPDGSLAFIPSIGGLFAKPRNGDPEPRIQIVNPKGELVKSIAPGANCTPFFDLGFDGKRVVYSTRRGRSEAGIAVQFIDGGAGREFPLPPSALGHIGLLLPEGLDEVWVYSQKPVIERYALDVK